MQNALRVAPDLAQISEPKPSPNAPGEEEARFARRKSRFIAFSLQGVPAMPSRRVFAPRPPQHRKDPPYPDRHPLKAIRPTTPDFRNRHSIPRYIPGYFLQEAPSEFYKFFQVHGSLHNIGKE